MNVRTYGYRRHSKRFNDVQKQDEIPVIDKETLPTLKAQPVAGTFIEYKPEAEEIELKFGAGTKKVVEPAKPVEDPDQDTGDLPQHMTGFMATDNITPSISKTAEDELVEPEE